MSWKNAKVIGANVSYETYSRQDAKRGDGEFSMSRGELVNFASNPAKWIAGFKEDSEATPSTDWGSMIDCLLTSPEKFDANFAVSPETYPDAKTGEPKPWTGAANFCKAWKKEQGDKTIIKSETMGSAEKAVSALRENQLIAELFSVSKKQVMVAGFWLDEATGLEIPIRVLIDLMPPKDHAIFGKWICDFKTARDGNPAKWPRVIDDHSYDVQAALITDLWIAATGEDRTDFVHIVQENVAPFHVTTPLPALSAEFLQYGRTKYQAALAKYAQCLATNVWPSYAPGGEVMFGLQMISPDELWSYRKIGGGEMAKRIEYQERPQSKPEENHDVTP